VTTAPTAFAALNALIEPMINALGYDLVDIETSPKGQILRLYIDRLDRQRINVEDCSTVSNAVQDTIEANGVDYERLEVSSPGIERALNRLAHFQRFVGETVALRLHEAVAGRLVFDAQLVDASATCIVVEIEGERMEVLLANIKKARLKPVLDWNAVENHNES
jgi:ribosome maturation factor RimP